MASVGSTSKNSEPCTRLLLHSGRSIGPGRQSFAGGEASQGLPARIGLFDETVDLSALKREIDAAKKKIFRRAILFINTLERISSSKN
jgi:hypothetical protein